MNEREWVSTTRSSCGTARLAAPAPTNQTTTTQIGYRLVNRASIAAGSCNVGTGAGVEIHDALLAMLECAHPHRPAGGGVQQSPQSDVGGGQFGACPFGRYVVVSGLIQLRGQHRHPS